MVKKRTLKRLPLSKSWLNGQLPPDLGAMIAITEARKALPGWTEKRARSAAQALEKISYAWVREKAKDPEWGLLDILAYADPIERFALCILSDERFAPLLKEISPEQAVAVLMLKESASGNSSAAAKGTAVLLLLKDATYEVAYRRLLPDIKQGSAMREGQDKGRREHRRERQKVWDDIKEEAKKIHKKRGGLGITKIRKTVAKNLNQSFGTVRRCTKDWESWW